MKTKCKLKLHHYYTCKYTNENELYKTKNAEERVRDTLQRMPMASSNIIDEDLKNCLLTGSFNLSTVRLAEEETG
jgi:hypothetical protein